RRFWILRFIGYKYSKAGGDVQGESLILFRAVELWRKGLDEGLSWAQRCRITAFVELERMIWRHKDNILNTVRNGLGDEPQDQVAAQDRLRLPQHRHDDRPCHAVLLVNRNSMARQKAERPNKQRPWHDSDGMRRPTLMPEEPEKSQSLSVPGGAGFRAFCGLITHCVWVVLWVW
ncbi:MAG: transposase, partial [Kiritimatiellae bacterium]|nr:transposase [Kiritimatiellia bacterium]